MSNNNEPQQKDSSSTKPKTFAVIEDDVQRILESAGIESEPMDPQSLLALKKMVASSYRRRPHQQHQQSNGFAAGPVTTASKTGTVIPKAAYPPLKTPPPPPVDAPGYSGNPGPSSSYEKPVNGTTRRDGRLFPSPSSFITPAAGTGTAFPAPKKGSNTKSDAASESSNSSISAEAVMAQLQQQTQLMMQLQQQVHALHQKVNHLQQQQPQQTQRQRYPDPTATMANAGITSPAESSLQSDGERSFTFARTRIYMRPSLSEEEEVSPRQQQDAAAAAASAVRQRRIATRRFVMAENDGDGDDETDQTVVPAAAIDAGVDVAQQQQQRPPVVGRGAVQQQGPQPAPQVPLLIRIILSPFQLVVRYWQFEYQVLAALYRMGRREVRPLNGGLLMQLFFVSLVVAKSSKDPAKQQVLISVVIMGFLYQMKILAFLYTFFIKNNVPLRIWKGMDPEGTEDIFGRNNNNNDANVANGNQQQQPPAGQPLPPRLRGQNANGDANAIGNGWEDTFFMGGIAAPNNGDNAEGGGVGNPISQLLWDIIYLFGSFFFSIFPMWRAEQRPRPVTAQPAEEAVQEEEAAAEQLQQQDPQIPQVQPPRDAMEPADSDDDEEDD